MAANNRSSISQAETYEQIGEFWDTHDFTDYDDPTLPDVEMTVSGAVAIEAELLAALDEQAERRGVTVETLVNLWLQQKLSEETPPSAEETEIAA
ncbi:MAG: hypothetical protein JMDDDDMK_02920 [Acidobacteria bacterium]|nr:hypothetical protein [Acidobacteriota bacterium]